MAKKATRKKKAAAQRPGVRRQLRGLLVRIAGGSEWALYVERTVQGKKVKEHLSLERVLQEFGHKEVVITIETAGARKARRRKSSTKRAAKPAS